MGAAQYLRIGELSDRTGVAPALLRAWERRYGLLQPARSDGGFRLYGDGDVERVRRVQHLVAGGVAPAEAARLVLGEGDTWEEPGSPLSSMLSPRPLVDALARMDDGGANAILDRMLAGFSPDAVIGESLVPALREIGDRWEGGELAVGQEHFASAILRERLLALGRGWDRGGGAGVVLACPPGERHDLPLVMLGLALRSRGWRITFLGADTPLDSVADAAERVGAGTIVLGALMPGVLETDLTALRRLSRERKLVLAGPAATPQLAAQVGALHLEGDPVAAADALAALVG